MNRGVFESSQVQHMMVAGNANWWAINATRPPSNHHTDHQQYNNINCVQHLHFPSPPNNCTSGTDNQDHQITPDSWSQQLFMNRNGFVREEGPVMEQLVKEEEFNPFVLKNHCNREFAKPNKKYNSLWSRCHNPSFINATTTTSTTTSVTTTSSPQSCVTTNFFEISSAAVPKSDHHLKSECDSSAVNNNWAAVKRGKVQNSAPQSSFKVRKLGDRITTLHQLVSPFGKTDTASVLLEAIGYIRFLESQIEALSIPYLRNGSENNRRQPHPPSVQGVRRCMFPEDAGQLLKDNCLKRKGGPDQEKEKELRSRGLCLVPVSSCTMNVDGRDNEADY